MAMNEMKIGATLTHEQAQAVYSAMCALNNVCGRIDTSIPVDRYARVQVYEAPNGKVFVCQGRIEAERYADQSAFATAYGLDTGSAA